MNDVIYTITRLDNAAIGTLPPVQEDTSSPG